MTEHQLLLAFYGDDFTGSTDAMEALAAGGYRTILFLEAPEPGLLTRFPGVRCIGVAGTSRSKQPEEMAGELRPIFAQLALIGAPLIHYKVCSTFDSAPHVGSIGAAIALARTYFPAQRAVPLLVGAPPLGRYTLFGQHFARMGEAVHRLDRHPVMSRHPITPMGEADLRLHLAEQTDEPIELLSILDQAGSYEEMLARYKGKAEQAGIVLLDVLDEERLAKAGRLLWETGGKETPLVVGSSGVGYALAAYWQAAGFASPAGGDGPGTAAAAAGADVPSADTGAASASVAAVPSAAVPSAGGAQPAPATAPGRAAAPARQVLAVSGSASMVTAQQIAAAEATGFAALRIPPAALASAPELPEALLAEARALLADGKSVILYTALGPDDPAIAEARASFAARGIANSGEFIGRQLGRWMRLLATEAGIRRLIIAGGDTSGFVTKEMGVYGLELLLPISPGAPLCIGYSQESETDGIELALKGGQLGGNNYFVNVLRAAAE